MRPLLRDDSFADRSRSSDDVTRVQPPLMTYFMADEQTMESSSNSYSNFLPATRSSLHKNNFGVESYETISSQQIIDKTELESRPRNLKSVGKNLMEKHTGLQDIDHIEGLPSPFNPSPDMSRNIPPSPSPPQNSMSRPFTPLSPRSPTLASSMGSPDSRIISDGDYATDEKFSHDVTISRADEQQVTNFQLTDGRCAPQFVMPSIKMPSRRPFTEKGKNMGRLKVLIAGDSGVGKTSLVKAMVQTCQDIVHVDPIRLSTPNSSRGQRSFSRRTKSKSFKSGLEPTRNITEIFASTRPYPSWWSDLEESHVIKKRGRKRGIEDTVLERNICFVDTPGYGDNISQLECVSSVVSYVESQFKKLSVFEASNESEMINLLSGNGGTQVDLVLYVISNGVKTIDIEYLGRLSQLTSIIPLIAHADTHSEKQISTIKKHIMNELQSVDIKPFSLQTKSSHHSVPFAISCKTSRDLDYMDGSLLMSPDYVHSLIESELGTLVSQIFERDVISWLRYTAAKKFILWRSSLTLNSMPHSIYQPLSTLSSSHTLTAPVGATTSFALARITDHTQREERIAQVRLANWASELQRSLQNERSRFENVAQSERALWLTQRLSECVQDGTIIPLSQARQDRIPLDSKLSAFINSRSYSQNRYKIENNDTNDPLGLIILNYEFKRKGLTLVKIVSSLGIISGLAFCVARAWFENWLIFGIDISDFVVI